MNQKLVEIDISWNGLGLQGSQALAKCLKENTTLKVLDISSNRITRDAFIFITDGMLGNQTLERLLVSH